MAVNRIDLAETATYLNSKIEFIFMLFSTYIMKRW